MLGVALKPLDNPFRTIHLVDHRLEGFGEVKDPLRIDRSLQCDLSQTTGPQAEQALRRKRFFQGVHLSFSLFPYSMAMINKVAISGSWKNAYSQVERDVRKTVASAIERGDGIVTGGALGVDSIATDEVLKGDFDPDQLEVILPTSLQTYSAHYRQRAEEGVIPSSVAETLIAQLEEVRARGTLVEMANTAVNQESYFARNTAVLEAAHELAAFHVNGSPGTQDTIEKARLRGMEVAVQEYFFAP